MTINNDIIIKWIKEVAIIKGIEFNANSLADDVFLMTYAYKNPIEFEIAMENVVSALQHIVNNSVNSSQLTKNYGDWDSYHFQSKRVQRQKSDLRIIYQKSSNSIRIRGFGNKWIPTDIYGRLRPRNT